MLHATSLRIPVVEVEGGTLTAVAGFDGHQGIALVVGPRAWASPDDILALASQRSQPPLVLVLDSLEDPQNVGTLLRTAEASGVHGAIFPTHHQAPLTPAAIKASAGAVEHLRLAPVDDLPGALADLHARGLRIVGADGDAPLTAREADLRGPVAIVVGSEGKGLGAAVRRRCDLLVRIPMHGRIDSLNAAVAGSILLYEAAAQRGTGRQPDDDAERRAGPPNRRPRRPTRREPSHPPSRAAGVDPRARRGHRARRGRERTRRGRERPRRAGIGPDEAASVPDDILPRRAPDRGRRTPRGRDGRRPGARRRRPVRRSRGASGGLTRPATGRIIPRLAESYSCLTLRACRRSSIGRAAVL